MNGLSRLSKISQKVIVFLKPEFFKNCRRYFKRIYVKLVLCKNQFLLFIKCFFLKNGLDCVNSLSE